MMVLKPTIIGFSAICSLFHGEGMMVLKIDHYRTFCNLSPLPQRGNDGAETDHYRTFCNPSPLPVGEGKTQ